MEDLLAPLGIRLILETFAPDNRFLPCTATVAMRSAFWVLDDGKLDGCYIRVPDFAMPF